MSLKSTLVLVVVGGYAMRGETAELVMSAGYRTCSVSNGHQGIQALKENRPDLIIMELGLPVLHGKVLLKRLKENDMTDIPVILLLKQSEAGCEKELQTPVTQIIYKPDGIDQRSKEEGSIREFEFLEQLREAVAKAFKAQSVHS